MTTLLDRTGKRTFFYQARAAEHDYARNLRGLARQVGNIVQGMAPDASARQLPKLVDYLMKYAEIIEPWAASVATYMLADVWRRDKAMWFKHSAKIGAALKREIEHAPTGELLRKLQKEQVKLIKSIPQDAAKRVSEYAVKSRIAGARHEDLAKALREQGGVSANKAKLIARTESSRAAANLVQARAIYAGSPGYYWRTSRDKNVRESHVKMEGVYVEWSRPPKTDKSLDPYHAGCGPNCRCFAEPVFPGF